MQRRWVLCSPTDAPSVFPSSCSKSRFQSMAQSPCCAIPTYSSLHRKFFHYTESLALVKKIPLYTKCYAVLYPLGESTFRPGRGLMSSLKVSVPYSNASATVLRETQPIREHSKRESAFYHHTVGCQKRKHFRHLHRRQFFGQSHGAIQHSTGIKKFFQRQSAFPVP